MGQIWAIARNVIKEILKMRILIGFLVLVILCATVGMAFWLHAGQDPADQKLKTFLSYSLSICWTLLGLLTVFISAASVTRDLKNKEIYTITTKSISRGQYLVGKFVGLALLNLILIVIVGGLIYGLARGLEHATNPDDPGYFKLKELVFVARKSVEPPVPDVSQIVMEKVEKLVEQKKNEEPVYRTDSALVQQMRLSLYREIEKQEVMKNRTVSPGSHITWHFKNIKPIDRENGLLFIRYKHEVSSSPPDLKVVSQWAYGPVDPLVTGGSHKMTSDAIRTVHEFAIPASELSPGGELFVIYRNPVENSPVSIIFPTDAGIEVLYVAGGFEANFLRSILLLYLRLVFLSILGIAMGAWLSFPVAILAMLVIFILGISSSFILDVTKWEMQQTQQIFTRVMLTLLPRFASYDPISQIEKGGYVSWSLLSQCGLVMILVKGGLLAGFGYLVFKFRELAKVIV